jgi:protein-tyrosine phosphatase
MKILFVCLGNICRSPIADGVMRSLVAKHNLNWQIDSAGTSNYHINEAPDKRAQKISKKYGVDISELRGRQFTQSDFDEFDYIFAMDASNYQNILKLARNQQDINKVELFLNRLEPGMNRGVQDPWYDDALFEPVFKEIEKTCKLILSDLATKTT